MVKEYTVKIFINETEADYNNSNRYAFLNWRFDNGLGSNEKENPRQMVFDNFEMGKAYLANAVLTLNSIIHVKNKNELADSLIFPVLFDIWHGIELLLKSGIRAISICKGNKPNEKNTHKIHDLYLEFENDMNDITMETTASKELSHLNDLIDEFNRVGANFDFARYSFSGKDGSKYQFYNAPYSDPIQHQKPPLSSNEHMETVPNTRVDIVVLFETLCRILDSFQLLIHYLTTCTSESESPTDAGFAVFRNAGYIFDDIDTIAGINDEESDPIVRIMDTIFLEIL